MNRKPSTTRRWVSGVGAIVLAILWAFPVYWMINSSFLPTSTLTALTPTFLPFGGSWANFHAVLFQSGFTRALGWSIAITFITLIVAIAFAFVAALAISRFRFRGRRSFVLVVLLVQMLPAEALFIAQYQMISSVHLLNTVIGVSIIYIAVVIPFTVWMLRGFVAGIPVDLEEAAMVDGLSRNRAFLKITFPLLAPGLVAAAVYGFLQAWNEFAVALILLPDGDKQTLPLWLRGFIQSSAVQTTNWGQVMAASTLVAVPVIVFFMFVQGRMTAGLVGGAVKG